MRALALLLLPFLATPATARDTWSTPHPGVRLLDRTTNRPWHVTALVVDLCHSGVSVRATARNEKRRTASSFGELVGAEAVVNADFFSYDTYDPTGLAMHDGNRWHADMAGSGDLLFGDDSAWLSLPGRVADPPAWAREAVGGRPTIVDGGEVPREFNRGDCAQRHPRTAAGLSKDRRTLILAVVDGRSGSSVGATCAELGGLMRELGAWRAMNLDGGGSSTMWVRGRGVVNRPSDGSQRVVANHLAILAGGDSVPGSCDFSEQEPVDQASQVDAPGTTDVNGDGLADACARGYRGVDCHLADGNGGFGARWRLEDLGNEAGCDGPGCWATIRTGDVNGDGFADVCARKADGFRCWPGGAGGFGAAIAGPPLTNASGWNKPEYYTTLRVADVTGDGLDDVCARAAAGWRCWPATGQGFGASFDGPELSDAGGWDAPARYGTIRTGDLDGDGRADVCARGGNGVKCWRGTGAGFTNAVDGPDWTDAAGYADVAYWSTFRFADVSGDGRADVCIRSASDVRCAISNGNGFGGAAAAGAALADDSGWRDHGNYGTIRLGDVDGNGTQDLCARANARVYCWLSDGARPFARRIDGPELADGSGWGHFRFHGTIRLADVNGDGRDDLCARSSAGLRCWLSAGNGFGAAIAGPNWADDEGWDALQYYSTFRLGTPRVPDPVEPPPPPPDPDAAVPPPVPDAAMASPDAGPPPDGAPSPDAGTDDAAFRPEPPDPFDAAFDTDGAFFPDGAPPPDDRADFGEPDSRAAAHHDGGCQSAPAGAPLWLLPLALPWRRKRASR